MGCVLRGFWFIVAAACLATASGAAWAQTAAGHFLAVVGDVQVLGRDGVQRGAAQGNELREGDTIRTGANGFAQVRLRDGGLLSVRAATEMKLERFSYAGKNDTNASLVISLMKGGFRSITGLIGKLNRSGYRVTTPTATIGIRGTDHEPFFMPAPPPGVSSEVPPGTYDRVYSGTTFIQNTQGVTQDINANQVGFVSITGAAPALLPARPSIYRTPTPAPRALRDGEVEDSKHAAAPADGGDPADAPSMTQAGGAGHGVLLWTPLDPIGVEVGVIAPLTIQAITPVITNVVAPVADGVIAPVTTNVIAPLTNNVIAPVTTNVVTPLVNGVIVPVTTNVIAPLTTTVIAPLTTTVIAPLTSSILAAPTPTAPTIQVAPVLPAVPIAPVVPVVQQLLTAPLLQQTPLAPILGGTK